MKWFKHETDAYTNLKLEQVLDEFGMAGYGFFWLCCELVGHQGGDTFMLKAEKNWKNALMRRSKFNEERADTILSRFAALELVDKKALNKGILYIPKMEERCDVYTNRVRTRYAQGSHNVLVEEKRIEKKRLDKKPGDNLKIENKTPGPGEKGFLHVGQIIKQKAQKS